MEDRCSWCGEVLEETRIEKYHGVYCSEQCADEGYRDESLHEEPRAFYKEIGGSE